MARLIPRATIIGVCWKNLWARVREAPFPKIQSNSEIGIPTSHNPIGKRCKPKPNVLKNSTNQNGAGAPWRELASKIGIFHFLFEEIIYHILRVKAELNRYSDRNNLILSILDSDVITIFFFFSKWSSLAISFFFPNLFDKFLKRGRNEIHSLTMKFPDDQEGVSPIVQ